MISNSLREELLKSIETNGAVDVLPQSIVNIHLDGGLNRIIDYSSGSPRLKTSVTKKFQLIVMKPTSLADKSSLEIRCCQCKRIISFPVWHYSIRYIGNEFHYFICFHGSKSVQSCNSVR